MRALFQRSLRRALAYLVDTIVVFVILIPQQMLYHSGFSSFGWLALIDLLRPAIVGYYIVGSHCCWGRTLGKRLFRLRVATVGGFSPPPLRAALLRFSPMLLYGFTAWLIAWFFPSLWRYGAIQVGRESIFWWQISALIWIVSDASYGLIGEGYRSLHDLIGGTVVTDESARKTNSSATNLPLPSVG